ncbi:glycosyltransferase [Chelativorans salis]|uniref:Glycosyltransferase n=1 Tax=Chelativorans salis TaxID=2978478 RepID=A0ABT2LTK7_9HYPH|nr:glycosyltransferase [Chelativorans sp. EGI FJ00035]MCT7376948.1 glycosyltransferase [Chelativorans sp. EGI FJ00035]
MRQVLHTITGLNVGGAESMLTRFVAQIDDAGYPSTVLSLLSPGALATQLPCKTQSNLLTLAMQRAMPGPGNLLALQRLVRQNKPNLIHGWMYHGNLAALIGSVASFIFAPVIWSVHHTVADIAQEEPRTRRLLRYSAVLSHHAAAICYCSNAAAYQHERLGFDPRRSVVIPNGIDCHIFCPTYERRVRLRSMLAIPPKRRIIGHFARYHPMKDQLSLVRAVSIISRNGYDVQLVVVGGGHQDGPVREAASKLGIDDRVTTLGIRHDIAELLPGLDVFALSSAWGEAFSVAAGEAMASGVPVVATDVGDSNWLVGPTGMVVPPSDPNALAAALAEVLGLSREDREALGDAARERIVSNFSLEIYVNRYLALYEQVLKGGYRANRNIA